MLASKSWPQSRPSNQPPRIPKNLEAQLAPHLYPQPRVAQGLWLVRHGLASAAIDLSDGLSTDLAHICEESGVAAEVNAAALPIHPAATLPQALNGGEDYELLFTAPPLPACPAKSLVFQSHKSAAFCLAAQAAQPSRYSLRKVLSLLTHRAGNISPDTVYHR